MNHSAWRSAVFVLAGLNGATACVDLTPLGDGQSPASTVSTVADAASVDVEALGVEAGQPSIRYAAPVVLTIHQNGPRALTLSNTHVVWSNFEGKTIAKASRDHDGTEVAPATAADQPDGLDIEAFGNNLAWLRSDGYVIFSTGVSGFRNCDVGLRLTQDANNLIYSERCSNGTINLWRVPKASVTERVVILQGTAADPIGAIATDGLSVFVARKTAIFVQGGVDAGSPTFAITNSTVLDMAVDETNVYWLSSNGTVNQLAKSDRGKTPMVLASQQAGLARVFVYQNEVYWTAGGAGGPTGKVVRASVDGTSNAEVLADGQNEPFGIAADATGVYWANHGDGTIMKLPRL